LGGRWVPWECGAVPADVNRPLHNHGSPPASPTPSLSTAFPTSVYPTTPPLAVQNSAATSYYPPPISSTVGCTSLTQISSPAPRLLLAVVFARMLPSVYNNVMMPWRGSYFEISDMPAGCDDGWRSDVLCLSLRALAVHTPPHLISHPTAHPTVTAGLQSPCSVDSSHCVKTTAKCSIWACLPLAQLSSFPLITDEPY
jgi:hypothetical protein